MLRHSVILAVLFTVGIPPLSLHAADDKPTTTSAPTTQPVHLLPPQTTMNELKTHLLPRIPKFVTPTDPDAWMAEAEKIRQRMLNDVVFRGVPESWYKTPTKAVWGDKLPGKGYTIKKLRYEIVPGFWAGALLYEPDNLKELVPAMLNVNGHVGPEGMSIPYEQIRRINLAKRGLLTLGLEWTGMGELSAPEYHHHGGAYLELCGISNISIHYLALKRGLDILLEQKFADPERVAVTGLSGGGWQTIMISSLDTRVKLTAPNAGYIGWAARIQVPPDFGDQEQCPVDMGLFADYVHLTAMLAPRFALQISNQNDTCCFQTERLVPSIVEPIRPVYELFGKPENYDFHNNVDPGTHNYDRDNREAYYKFVNKHFLAKDQRKDEEIPVDDEVRKQSELAVDYPKENGSFLSLTLAAMKDLPELKRPTERNAMEEWQKKVRQKLREVIRLPSEPSKVTATPCDAKAFVADNIETHSWLLKIGDDWTIPVVELVEKGVQPRLNKLIFCDSDRNAVKDLIEDSLENEQRVFVVDILGTGECMSAFNDTTSINWMLAISALGERPLGIQVGQLHALTGWIKTKYPNLAIHTHTRLRVSGMAALTHAAVYPGDWALLKTLDMESSLKNLTHMKMSDIQSQSVFCTGFLKIADIPDLALVALPTRVEPGKN